MSAAYFELPKPDLSVWRDGNTGVPGVWHFDSGRPGRCVMICALMHGNEFCGAWALCELLATGLRPDAGALTLALCNLAAFDRFDPANPDAARFVDEDLNRQWQDARIDAGGSRERRRAAQLRPFVRAADWLLDLHSTTKPGAPLTLTGPHARNLALARAMATPEYLVIDAGHRSGTRLRDYGRFGLPDAGAGDSRSLLVECGLRSDPASRSVARDQCLRFLRAAGSVDASDLERLLPDWRLPDAAQQWALTVTQSVVASSERFRFTQAFASLQVIARAGSVIGDNDGVRVVTPYDDCVLVMPDAHQLRAGATVVRFARRARP